MRSEDFELRIGHDSLRGDAVQGGIDERSARRGDRGRRAHRRGSLASASRGAPGAGGTDRMPAAGAEMRRTLGRAIRCGMDARGGMPCRLEQ
ncbi:hypothetical protein BURPS305_7853 [Burkholderia pseudomallei 305]|nr:hypothetical protein BURPS305_7853 [Burkholderia pseudomallei 305]